MSRRKHLTQQALEQHVQPPDANQSIVRAIGSRGGNIVEVEYADGRSMLCLMPAKFNKKLWVRRGGYLIIEESEEAHQDSSSRVTGTIVSVLYDDHVRQLKKIPGVWPAGFGEDAASASSHLEQEATAPASGSEEDGDEGGGSASGSDDSLEPLHQNSNRRVIYYEVSDSEEEDEDGEEEEGEEEGEGAQATGSGEGADMQTGPGEEQQKQQKQQKQQQNQKPGVLSDEEQDRILNELGQKLLSCELGKKVE